MRYNLNKTLTSEESLAAKQYWKSKLSLLTKKEQTTIAIDENSDKSYHIEKVFPERLIEKLKSVSTKSIDLEIILVIAAELVYQYKVSGKEHTICAVSLSFPLEGKLEEIQFCPLIVTIDSSFNFIKLCESVKNEYNNIINACYYPLELIDESIDEKLKSIVSFSFNEKNIVNHKNNRSLVSIFYNADNNKISFSSCSFVEYELKDRLNDFVRIFTECVHDFNKKIYAFDLLVEDVNSKIRSYSYGLKQKLCNDDTIVTRFGKVSQEIPDNIAIVEDDRTLTFKELNFCSEQFAAYLQDEFQLSKGDSVAVILDSSLELVISFLAIQRAGYVYVPIDSNLPIERQLFLINNSNTKLLITSKTKKIKFNCTLLPQTILIDDIKLTEWNIVRQVEFPVITLDDPSFIIYSSGTTGIPKGAIHKHSCLANLIKWQIFDSGIPEGLNHLQYTAVGFDVSVQEISFSLLSKGVLFVTSDQLKNDFIELEKFLINNKIHSCYMTCSVLNSFFSVTSRLMDDGCLQYIITGGESLSLNNGLKKYLLHNKKAFVYNFYGPCETHGLTWFPINFKNLDAYFPPIGKPITNCITILLDENRRLVNVGTPGEIYLGGNQVALKYINNPGLTESKFIFLEEFENVFYRTGDYGKWNTDGNMEFIGRKDSQLKIRGNRVELKEIEEVLLTHASIRQASIQAYSNENDVLDIVCFYLLNSNVSVDDLSKHLKIMLPNFMIPNFFIFLNEFPFTENKKLDLKKLELIYTERKSSVVSKFKLPNTEIEQGVFNIWENVLGHSDFGITDNFFEVGGNSLKIIQLHGEVCKMYSINMGVADLFELKSVIEICNFISRSNTVNNETKYLQF